MTNMTRLLCILAIAALALGACGKSEQADAPKTDDQAAADKAAADKAAADKAAADQAAADKAAADTAAADENADYIKTYATHTPSNEGDPVEINIEKFAVTSAQLDPKNLEGATAEIELDLTSIKSGADKRDMHLQTPDYLDVPKFGNAKIKVSEVKKGEGENTYNAQAEVSVHGVTKSYPVSFEVLETTEDSVRVKAEHTFSRLDFSIGKEPDGENEKVSKDLTIKAQLTLKNTK